MRSPGWRRTPDLQRDNLLQDPAGVIWDSVERRRQRRQAMAMTAWEAPYATATCPSMCISPCALCARFSCVPREIADKRTASGQAWHAAGGYDLPPSCRARQSTIALGRPVSAGWPEAVHLAIRCAARPPKPAAAPISMQRALGCSPVGHLRACGERPRRPACRRSALCTEHGRGNERKGYAPTSPHHV